MRNLNIVRSGNNGWRGNDDGRHQLWMWWPLVACRPDINAAAHVQLSRRLPLDKNTFGKTFRDHPLGRTPQYHPRLDSVCHHDKFGGLCSVWSTMLLRNAIGLEHGKRGTLQRGRMGGTYGSFYLSKFDHAVTPNVTRRISRYQGDIPVQTWRRRYVGGQLMADVESLEVLFQQGSEVDASVVCGILKRCIAQKDLALGIRVHVVAAKTGMDGHSSLANHIVCMYVCHGKLEEATQIFCKVPMPTHAMWTSIILAHARHGKPVPALSLYRQMRKLSFRADSHLLVAVLKACASTKDLASGLEIHADILGSLNKPNLFVQNCILDMYGKCGGWEDARRVFDNSPNRDVVTWNTMIGIYAQHGLLQEALELYSIMEQEGITLANHITFICLLQACARAGDLNTGKQLHGHIQERGLEADVVLCNSLISMYAKCGSLEDACRVFDNLPRKDVVTWTALIAGYGQHGLGDEALKLYGRMQQEGIIPADAVTFVCLLQACARIGDLHHGIQLHAQVQKRGLETDVTVGNSVVNMYAKCGSFEDARRVFDNLAARDVVTWNAMIMGYAQYGLNQEALNLYANMQEEGITLADAVTFVCLLQACGNLSGLEKGKEIHAEISKSVLRGGDLVIGNALVDMYGKCGSMVEAQHVFDSLSTKDIMTWSALIAGYARQGDSQPVFSWFERMRREGIQPNHITFLSVLTVCSHVGLVDEGRNYFEAMSRDYGITPTIEHYNCMVDLLGRAGQIDEAMELMQQMPFQPPVDAWRSLLGACQKWNRLELGRHAFECAVRADVNDSAAYIMMSNIYASAGMWEEAKEVHSMRRRARAFKEPGQSWLLDFAGITHSFEARDGQHFDRQHIYQKLEFLSLKNED